jgi:hypothetical protein
MSRDAELEMMLARRRSHQRASSRRMIAPIIASVVMALCGLAAFISWPSRTSRSNESLIREGKRFDSSAFSSRTNADSLGDEWTDRKLWEFINSKGVPCRLHQHRYSTWLSRKNDDLHMDLALIDVANDHGVWKGVVRVEKFETHESAHRAVESVEKGPLQWGKWVFYGDAEMVSKIKQALP